LTPRAATAQTIRPVSKNMWSAMGLVDLVVVALVLVLALR